jgi:hypothetical protein
MRELLWHPADLYAADVLGGAAITSASPRVVVHQQADAGHNLSLGLTAKAYHLTVLAFVEECVRGK